MDWVNLIHSACDHDRFSKAMLTMQSEFCDKGYPEDCELWKLMDNADESRSMMIGTLYEIAGYLDASAYAD